MRKFSLLAVIFAASVAQANDWLTLPSTYSHDARGARVTQYAPIEAPTTAAVSNFQTSGYTHTRSSLNYGQSADNYHRVEEWGAPVRPYGEWRFPFRPFSTPYPNWGPPFAGLNLGFPFPGPYGQFDGGNGRGQGGFPPNVNRPGRPGEGNWQGGGNGPGGNWPGGRNRFGGTNTQASPFNPYPAGPGSPYPVAPYYDGYYPNYRD
jgi:hypothetical protein